MTIWLFQLPLRSSSHTVRSTQTPAQILGLCLNDFKDTFPFFLKMGKYYFVETSWHRNSKEKSSQIFLDPNSSLPKANACTIGTGSLKEFLKQLTHSKQQRCSLGLTSSLGDNVSWVGGNLNSTAPGAQITYLTSYLIFPRQHNHSGALAWKVHSDGLVNACNSEATGFPSCP